MKVFISWSGARSKKVAIIFRDWLPSVIQSVNAFVSSEDIEKGARWNTDIAQELKESTFGIICVTKDNLGAPWLNFEAGALSKTIENTYVAPFLFDVKPSELSGSPISQFQATSFNKDDVKRLTETLNIAAGEALSSHRLESAFNLWYTSLENQLKILQSEKGEEEHLSTKSDELPVNSDILEEILETSRNTQRLLGNTDAKLHGNLDLLQKKTEQILSMKDGQNSFELKKFNRKHSPMFYDELLFSLGNTEFGDLFPYNLLIVFSTFKEDFPWLYDAGKDLVSVLNSSTSNKNKISETEKFKRLLEVTSSGHPIIREILGNTRKANIMVFHEISRMLNHVIEKNFDTHNI